MEDNTTIKQVILVRKDLALPKGKLCVQVAHASLTAFLEAESKNPQWARDWLRQGQKKIVLKVDNLKELLDLYRKATQNNLPTALIRDAGLTVLPPDTITCVGIGPAPETMIDKITGHLKLL